MGATCSSFRWGHNWTAVSGPRWAMPETPSASATFDHPPRRPRLLAQRPVGSGLGSWAGTMVLTPKRGYHPLPRRRRPDGRAARGGTALHGHRPRRWWGRGERCSTLVLTSTTPCVRRLRYGGQGTTWTVRADKTLHYAPKEYRLRTDCPLLHHPPPMTRKSLFNVIEDT